jgi:hypothetical protein
MHRSHRLPGALVGSAVGDALGAPFEFGPPGQFSTRFPVPARGTKTEMCGGGSLGWEPGVIPRIGPREGISVDEATDRVAERWPHLGLWNASFTAALEHVRPEGGQPPIGCDDVGSLRSVHAGLLKTGPPG